MSKAPRKSKAPTAMRRPVKVEKAASVVEPVTVSRRLAAHRKADAALVAFEDALSEADRVMPEYMAALAFIREHRAGMNEQMARLEARG